MPAIVVALRAATAGEPQASERTPVDGEAVCSARIEWPSKEARDAGMAKVFADPRIVSDDDTVAAFRAMLDGPGGA